MGYYTAGGGGGYAYQPDAAYGAQGGFLSGIAHFIGSKVSPIIGKLAPVAAMAPGPVGTFGKAVTIGQQAFRGAMAHPMITAAGGAVVAAGVTRALTPAMPGGAALRPGAMGQAVGQFAGGVVRGYHLEHRGKHAGQWIKNRRMNVCNPRALRRAIRRAHGFQRLALKVLAFSRPHGKPKGHAYFKRKARTRK